MARHNEIRDLLADVMREAVRDVVVETPSVAIIMGSGSKAGQPTARHGPAWASRLVASGRDSRMGFFKYPGDTPKGKLAVASGSHQPAPSL